MNNNNKRNKNRSLPRYANENRLPPTTSTVAATTATTNKVRAPTQGVYSNTFFMHAATPLVGNVVQLRLRSGNLYEGVFRTFSPNFDIALELPLCIQSNKNGSEDDSRMPNTMIFPYNEVVNIVAKDFDSQYATVGAFQTDAAISEKCNGARFEEKELEPWDSGVNGDVDIELDGASNGWGADEMFRKNENQFGVISTFDDSLSTYTVQIEKKDSLEFKEAELRAEKLAAEIENNPTCRDRLDIENGDEEAMFAAVERPTIEEERETERERGREREHGRERDLEREREDREQEREHDRKRIGTAVGYEPRGEPMPERYITKPIRSITGQPASAPLSANTSGSSSRTQLHQDRSDNRGVNSNEMIDRPERVINSQSSHPSACVGTMGQITNTTQLSTSGNMKGSISMSTPQSSSTSASATNVGLGAQSQDNNANNSGKYGGGSMMKRKNASQGGKLMRNTPPPNNNGGNGGNSGNLAPNGNNNSSGGKGSSAGNSYQSMSMNSQSSYQSYPQIHGPIYRNTSHMNMSNSGNTSKANSGNDSNGGKPMTQRNIRQYQSAQSNSTINYADNQNQLSKSRGSSAQGGNSPPLQTGASVGTHLSHGTQQSGMSGQPAPQSNRQMRSRDNHLQELRQFGHDFQLAPQSNQTQVVQQQQQTQPQPTQPTPHQSQQQSQPQQPQQAPPMHMPMGGNKGQPQTHPYHQPQPSVSPPQHQPTPQQQQLITSAQQPQTHVSTMHATQHLVQQPPPQHVPQHHYVQVQQQLPPQQYVSTAHMAHQQQSTAVPQTLQSQPQQQAHMMQTSIQQQQLPAPQQQAVPQPQISPVVIPTSPILEQPPPQPQLQQIVKNDTNIAPNTLVVQSPQQTQLSTTTVTATTTPISDKASTPPSAGSTTSGIGSGSTATTAVKKTHVLNPSAKPFTPRSPSTPNASRPHTPQTPVPQMAGIYPTPATAATAAQSPIFVMPPQQTAASFQVPTHPQGGQQLRPRRNNYAPITASQIHMSATAAAATGQPLLASGPMQQFIYQPQAPHPAHFQSQPYGHVMRMYPEPPPQQLQFLTQTPQSTTPSPGQPHQTFHPAPQPSPAGGGPQPAFAPQAQPQACQIVCPLVYPQLMQNPYYQPTPPLHAQQSQPFQIVMQHPAQ